MEYGIYSYFFTLATVIGIWSRVGSDLAVMRLGGEVLGHDPGLLKPILSHALTLTLIGSIAGAAALAITIVVTRIDIPSGWLVWLAMLLLFLIAQNGVIQAALLVRQRTFAALAPEMLLKPALAIGGAIVLAFAVTDAGLDAVDGIAIALCAAVASNLVLRMLAAGIVWQPALRQPDSADRKAWTRIGVSLMLVNACFLLFFHADTLLLGFLLGPAYIGTYQVAKQISQVGLFAMVAVQFVFSPGLASLVARRNWRRMRAMYWSTTIIGASFALAVLLTFGLFGRQIIRVVGSAYGDAWELTLIMLSAQLAIALLGPAGTLASMSGNARIVTLAYVGGAILMFALGPFAIDNWGLSGAAALYGLTAVLCTATVGLRLVWRLPLVNGIGAGRKGKHDVAVSA
jgi:O-antigen/teichoic acid export membrane protein